MSPEGLIDDEGAGTQARCRNQTGFLDDDELSDGYSTLMFETKSTENSG